MPDESRTPTAAGASGAVRLFGVPVRFHFTFLLLLVFLLFIGVGERQSGPATAAYVLALFGSVLLHELGHALAARRYSIATVEIVMYPIGGVARLERRPKAREEFWIALAGPVVNAAIAGLILGGMGAASGWDPGQLMKEPSDANLLQRIAFGNLTLFLFNLLPAYPMDGGRILRAVLAWRGSEDRATRVAARAGQAFAILMGLAGLLAGNFMLVFIAMFVWLGAAQEGALARGRILTSGYPASAAMITDFRTLSHGQTVRDAGNLLLATSQQDFPVVYGDGVIGLLSRAALVRAMLTEGPDAYVSSVMDRGFPRVAPEMPLAEAMLLIPGPGACALVMDGDRLVGLLTSENLSEFLMLRQVLQVQPK